MSNKLTAFSGTIFEQGWGIVPKMIMKEPNISIQAKAIYAYLCSYAGNATQAFPSATLMQYELGITKDTFYKYLDELIKNNYITVSKMASEKGRFAHNIYNLEGTPYHKIPDTVTPDTVNPDPVNQDTIINNPIINNLTKNNPISKTTTKAGFDNIINAYTEDEELKETIYDFIKMRKAIKKPMTDAALKLTLKKLNKLTGLTIDNETKIEILNQSIMNSWQGIFPLKQEQNTGYNKNVQAGLDLVAKYEEEERRAANDKSGDS